MTAEEIMTEAVTTIEASQSLGDAVTIMEEQGIRHLPVLDDGQLIGMLSDRDLRGLGVSMVNDLESLDRLRSRLGAKVATVMSGDVLTVSPVTEVSEIIDLLVDEKVSAVPVIGGENELVGIVSYIDVLRALRDTL